MCEDPEALAQQPLHAWPEDGAASRQPLPYRQPRAAPAGTVRPSKRHHVDDLDAPDVVPAGAPSCAPRISSARSYNDSGTRSRLPRRPAASPHGDAASSASTTLIDGWAALAHDKGGDASTPEWLRLDRTRAQPSAGADKPATVSDADAAAGLRSRRALLIPEGDSASKIDTVVDAERPWSHSQAGPHTGAPAGVLSMQRSSILHLSSPSLSRPHGVVQRPTGSHVHASKLPSPGKDAQPGTGTAAPAPGPPVEEAASASLQRTPSRKFGPPPALRVSISLLPSPLSSPADAKSLPSKALSSAAVGAGFSPGAAADPAPGSDPPPAQPCGPSRRSTLSQQTVDTPASYHRDAGPLGSPSPASGPAPAASSPAPMARPLPSTPPPLASHPPVTTSPPSTGPLTGLPSFLGAPMVLDTQPPPQTGGSGGAGAGPHALFLFPSPNLSRSTSGVESRSHPSNALAASSLQPTQVPLPAAQSLLEGPSSATAAGSMPVGSSSGRGRQCGAASNGFRRPSAGSGRLWRSGSYFKVREAVPEAVLESLPGVHAARGLPPQPQHPSAVPEDWPAAAGALSGSLLYPGSPLCAVHSGGDGAHSRRGMDLTCGRYGAGPGHLASGCSSPRSVRSGGGGAFLRMGSGKESSWLRRADAMPPTELLPIRPASPLDPVLAMAGVPLAAATRGSSRMCEGAPAARAGSGAGTGAASVAALATAGGGAASRASASAAVRGSPAAAAVPCVVGLSEAQVLTLPSHVSSEPSGAADGLSNSSVSASPTALPDLATPRRTFRTQTKLRLMHLSGVEDGEAEHGCSSPRHDPENEALLALLGSTRMLSSVLSVRGSNEGAVHGPTDPRYDPAAHIETIPEHLVASHAAHGLLGDTRMGSTVFSAPHAHTLGRAAAAAAAAAAAGSDAAAATAATASYPRRPVGRVLSHAASKAAVPDLELLRRRMGVSSVVAPDGHIVNLATPGSAPQLKSDLELAEPDELIAAVNGHTDRWGRSTPGSRSGVSFRPTQVTSSDGSAMWAGAASVSAPQVERLTPGKARSARSLRLGSLFGSSGGGRHSSDGRGSGGSSGAQHGLVRHMSAPPRRPEAVSACGAAPEEGRGHGHRHGNGHGLAGAHAAAALLHGRASAPGPGPHRGASLLAAGLRMLRRAFTKRLAAGAAAPAGRPGSGSRSEDAVTWYSTEAAAAAAAGERGSGGGGEQPLQVESHHTRSTRAGYCASHSSLTDGGRTSRPSRMTPTPSRRGLLASQKSFARHSAVLGWVQPEDTLSDTTGCDASDCEGGPVARPRRSIGGLAVAPGAVGGGVAGGGVHSGVHSGAGRLYNLQELLASGGGALTCDAVVDMDEAAADGGGGTARRRTRSQRSLATAGPAAGAGGGSGGGASAPTRASLRPHHALASATALCAPPQPDLREADEEEGESAAEGGSPRAVTTSGSNHICLAAAGMPPSPLSPTQRHPAPLSPGASHRRHEGLASTASFSASGPGAEGDGGPAAAGLLSRLGSRMMSMGRRSVVVVPYVGAAGVPYGEPAREEGEGGEGEGV